MFHEPAVTVISSGSADSEFSNVTEDRILRNGMRTHSARLFSSYSSSYRALSKMKLSSRWLSWFTSVGRKEAPAAVARYSRRKTVEVQVCQSLAHGSRR